MKTNLLILAALAITIVSCSKSDNDGAEKPNLSAVTEVAQSFSIIQLSAGNKSTNTNSSVQISTSQLKQQRSEILKKLVSNPALCKTSSVMGDNDGTSKPGEIVMNMNISGKNCPLTANFYSKNVSNQGLGSGSLQINYNFIANSLDAQKAVAARSGKVSGSFSFGISPNSDPNSESALMEGAGQFNGSVDSINHGQVSITMNFLMRVVLKSDSTNGVIQETTKFAFGDTNKNVTLKKVSNYSGTFENPSENTVYTANDASITKEEYEEILGGLSTSKDEPHFGNETSLVNN